jgi:hypothetical protein
VAYGKISAGIVTGWSLQPAGCRTVGLQPCKFPSWHLVIVNPSELGGQISAGLKDQKINHENSLLGLQAIREAFTCRKDSVSYISNS